jgi:hypothetical protein
MCRVRSAPGTCPPPTAARWLPELDRKDDPPPEIVAGGLLALLEDGGGLPNTILFLFELRLAMWAPRCAEVAAVQPDCEMLKFVMGSMGRTLTEAQCMQLLLIAMRMGHLQHAQYLSFQRKETPTELGRYSTNGRVYWSVMPVEAALKMPKLRNGVFLNTLGVIV